MLLPHVNTEEDLMRKKFLLARIVCLCLVLLYYVSACSPLGSGRNKETSAVDQTQASVSSVFDTSGSSAAATESHESIQQTGQGTPTQISNNTEQAVLTAAVGSSGGTELPEIEIPVATATPDTKAETQKTQPESVATESPEPGIPAAAPASPVSQPVQESENNGIIISNSGDILLPEVP